MTITPPPFSPRRLRFAAVLPLLLASTVAAEQGDMMLVREDLTIEPVRLVELGDQTLVYRTPDGRQVSRDLPECLALVDPAARPRPTAAGLLILTDGQRIPGQVAAGGPAAAEALSWSHPRLGQLDIPLQLVRSMLLERASAIPRARDLDVVTLTNGDRLEGFIAGLGDPIRIELDRASTVDVPLARVVAVTMVSPDQPRQGRRVWLADGTIFDARDIRIGDDGFVRLTCSWSIAGTQPIRLQLEEIAGIRFDTDRLVPLAGLAPERLEGPDLRYDLPRPEVTWRRAPLGLSPVRYRGPLVVRYALPAGSRRFAADAVLPPSAREWGDYELRIHDDDREIARIHLGADTPTATINVPLQGSELTIELTAGEYGPIQDVLELKRAMILVQD